MKHYKQFTREQRYQISGLKKAGLNQSQIAAELGVHKSTISREFRRKKWRRAWILAFAAVLLCLKRNAALRVSMIWQSRFNF